MNKNQIPKGYKNPLWLERRLINRDERIWHRTGSDRTLNLFHSMATRVPAYGDFLKKNRIDHKKIRSMQDFKQLPTIDKDNYLRAYPREMLCWDGDFKGKSWTISSTSGSTGEPYYFPRDTTQDWQYAILAELYLRANFNIHKKSTLYIVAFPMGAWIGGVFTYEAIKIVAARGKYNLSVITPGINKREVISAVKRLGHEFDQIIIGSYAPFLKDILDEGELEGIKWSDYNPGFVFSAEGFNETFRDYVIRKTKPVNLYTSTLNHYGTVDLGTMAHETPLSIMLRRAALEDKDVYNALFPREDKLPTFAQYNPALFYFEQNGDSLYCSAYSGIPLVRYDLKDTGGTIKLGQLDKKLNKIGYDINEAAKKNNIISTLWKLPFVYVYERNDFSVSFYAFQIYPEMIRKPLQDKKFEAKLTGKFSMEVVYDESGRQSLVINIELKKGQKSTSNLAETIRTLITKFLISVSSEYRETHNTYGRKVYPRIKLWPYEDGAYFKPGIKQQWVIKNNQ